MFYEQLFELTNEQKKSIRQIEKSHKCDYKIDPDEQCTIPARYGYEIQVSSIGHTVYVTCGCGARMPVQDSREI